MWSAGDARAERCIWWQSRLRSRFSEFGVDFFSRAHLKCAACSLRVPCAHALQNRIRVDSPKPPISIVSLACKRPTPRIGSSLEGGTPAGSSWALAMGGVHPQTTSSAGVQRIKGDAATHSTSLLRLHRRPRSLHTIPGGRIEQVLDSRSNKLSQRTAPLIYFPAGVALCAEQMLDLRI